MSNRKGDSVPELKQVVGHQYLHQHSRHRSTVEWNHVCSGHSFIVDLLNSDIVCSYASDWGIEPYQLPRVCALGDPNTKAAKLRCCDPCGNDKLQPPDRFWIPEGLPYMAATSLVWGPVYTTPFYSVIPRLSPQVPRSLFGMSRLTIQTVISNPVFRHELFFNPRLQLEPPVTTEQTMAATTRVWTHLEYELGEVIPPQVARAPTPILPQMLEGIGLLLLNIVPSSFAPSIYYFFHCGRLHREPTLLSEVIAILVQVFDSCCAPGREKWLAKIESYFNAAANAKPREAAGHLVLGLRTAVALLNMTKLDQVNSQVQERVSNLIASTVAVERVYLQSLVNHQHNVDGPVRARTWLLTQPLVESMLDTSAAVKSLRNPLLSRLCTGVLLTLRAEAAPALILPPAFALDLQRIVHIQSCLAHFVTARVEKKARAAISVKDSTYEEYLPAWLGQHQLPSSPVYRLIEARLMNQIALGTYRILRGVSKCQSGELQQMVDELATLIRLHWASAGPIYEKADIDLYDQYPGDFAINDSSSVANAMEY